MPDIPAVHCEVKKLAYRQTKDGLVVSFLIHPNDMPDTLATAPLGQRYMLALAAIGDDEEPVSPSQQQPNVQRAEAAAERPGVEPSSPTARARASERYHEYTPMEQARARAGILPSDLRFQQWVASETNGIATEEHAIAYIRERCCGGHSRSLIATDPMCNSCFLSMEMDYQFATGLLAEKRR